MLRRNNLLELGGRAKDVALWPVLHQLRPLRKAARPVLQINRMQDKLAAAVRGPRPSAVSRTCASAGIDDSGKCCGRSAAHRSVETVSSRLHTQDAAVADVHVRSSAAEHRNRRCLHEGSYERIRSTTRRALLQQALLVRVRRARDDKCGLRVATERIL